jgi:hypothetical protein
MDYPGSEMQCNRAKGRAARALFGVLLVLAGAVAISGCGSPAGSDGYNGYIPTFPLSGTITDATTGQGVANISVALTGYQFSASTSTDANGHYAFSHLNPQKYDITPTLAGASFTPPAILVTLDGPLPPQNFLVTQATPSSAKLRSPPVPAIRFTSFHIAGAIHYFVGGINDAGVVVGAWTAADGVTVSGFVRSPGGQITSPIVEPNDDTGLTVLRAINAEGVIVGFYGLHVTHGFVFADGTFSAWDLPRTAVTAVRGVNDRGDLSGSYSVVDGAADEGGFIAPRQGTPITFKIPEPAATNLVVGAINNAREVVGYYTTGRGVLAGFVRQPDGRIVTLAVPGAIDVQAYGINDCGIVVGTFDDGSTAHGFYGRPGSLHTLDLPGAAATVAQGINNEGRMVGRYADSAGEHGFVTEDTAAASCLSE